MESYAATKADPEDERTLEEVTKTERERAALPKWLVTLASELVCQACVDIQLGEQKILPYSLGSKHAMANGGDGCDGDCAIV